MLDELARGPPLTVIDTHAGAGVYDLQGEAALKSGEAADGIVRLMAEPEPPPVFAPLTAAVKAENGGADARVYPGSPVLTAARLRPGDRAIITIQDAWGDTSERSAVTAP